MDSFFIFFPEIINNLFILLGLAFLFGFTIRFLIKLQRRYYTVASGIIFGALAIGTMFSSFEMAPGIYGDLRNIVVMSSAIFSGPWAALVCTLMASVYRFYLGGYAAVGVIGILLAAGLGIVYYHWQKVNGQVLNQAQFFLLGLTLAFVSAIPPWIGFLMSLMPFATAFLISTSILSVGIIVYPIAAYLFGQLIYWEFKRIKDESVLAETNQRLVYRTGELQAVNERLEREIIERKIAEDALRESEEKFRAIAEQSGEGIAIANAKGSYVLVNAKFCQLTGYTERELKCMGIQDLVPKNTKISLFPKVLANQSGMREITIIRKDGSRFDAEIGGYPLDLHEERFVLGIVREITERKQNEKALRESEERFRNLVEGSVVGIIIDQNGKPLFVNQTYANIFGYGSPAEILELEALDRLYAPTEIVRLNHHRHVVIGSANQVPDRYEFQGVRKDGVLIWLEAQSQVIAWQGQQAVQSTVIDITERKNYQEQLFRQANFDEVTGLPNRFLVLDRIAQALNRARRRHQKVALLFLDLDQFKRVNDTLGHAAGDRLLREAAQRLQDCVRREDTVARLGGDEFTVILQDLDESLDAEPVAKKIIEAFSKLFIIDGHEVFVTTSIGITICPDDGNDPYILMQNADTAMYWVKDIGRNNYRFFTPELNAAAVARVALESHLHHALERGEFYLHYQPLINIRSERLEGMEALLRWNNANLGIVPPDRFIPVAEESGLIIKIGRWILGEACRQIMIWQRESVHPLRIALNVSSRQFLNVNLVDNVQQILKDNGLSPHALELEITERLLVEDLPNTMSMLQELSDLGIRFSIDDFGTGYSSLSYLKRFPVDTLKIDKSFIRDITTDPDDRALVEAIIAMGHSLGLEVVAEGVETAAQLELLRIRGCDLAQGYYFSKPLSADAFGEFLKNWHAEPRNLADG